MTVTVSARHAAWVAGTALFGASHGPLLGDVTSRGYCRRACAAASQWATCMANAAGNPGKQRAGAAGRCRCRCRCRGRPPTDASRSSVQMQQACQAGAGAGCQSCNCAARIVVPGLSLCSGSSSGGGGVHCWCSSSRGRAPRMPLPPARRPVLGSRQPSDSTGCGSTGSPCASMASALHCQPRHHPEEQERWLGRSSPWARCRSHRPMPLCWAARSLQCSCQPHRTAAACSAGPKQAAYNRQAGSCAGTCALSQGNQHGLGNRQGHQAAESPQQGTLSQPVKACHCGDMH